ncbi:MAG: ATP-dependent RNA helicase HrpA [Cellvibrionaceae bacterium]
MSTVVHSLSILFQQLEGVASHHRHRLFREYQRLEQQQGQADFESQQQALQEKINNSLDSVEKRRAALPQITFPEQLPIAEKRDEIAEAIQQYQVVVIAGETGSGKTTQLPKICLSIGRGVQGIIGHTQPRRIAARSVANRIAEELNSTLGDVVGYQVRFTDRVSDITAVKLMTDGILLAEIQRDRYLSRYDTIIIDEAHERSLNIDFLMGYLKHLLPKRPDLKVIITSATIDVEKFSRHFNNAPVIEVSGRTYPVDVLYRPLLDTGSESVVDGILNAINEISTIDTQGDILVFLSGERDIRETALKLRREKIPHLTVIPLYARLSIAEQNKVFQAHKGRRVVLATNVAETSLTVPGIRYVIDPGYARVSRYSFRTKVQRLPIEAISQASANQRKGRCGRVSEGVCIRLYSEDDFLSRTEFTDPEILRTNLAAVILQMAQLKLGDIRDFSFVDMPDHRLINDGYKLLQELQAITAKNTLTKMGHSLSQLPVDPRFGRMLLAADQLNCLQEVMVIVSALSIQDPRERPADKQQAADQKHREYWHEQSDFLAYWQLWQTYEAQRQALSSNQLQKWCKQHFLSFNRMREWRDIHIQLTMAIKSLSLTSNNQPANYAAIHTALITGLLGNIGLFSKEQTKDYIGARNRRFHVFPGSSQFKKTPQWILTAELLETSKLYAHTVARIETEWVLSVAQHQIKRQHVEPHYNPRSGQVMAYEKISLYGLVLLEKHPVSYTRINREESRDIFIRSALVESRYVEHKRIKNNLRKHSSETHFFCHQQQLIKELHELEAKSRRRDVLVDDQILFDFYHHLIPADITNLDGFEHWRESLEEQEPKLLFISRDTLMRHNPSHITTAQFPDSLDMDGIRVPVIYHFDPSHRDDGVTLKIPVSTLHLLSAERLQWLVPGLLAEKITAMIKSLPKQWRKQFAPVPSTVEKLLIKLPVNDQSLYEQEIITVISESLYRLTGVRIPEDAWDLSSLDNFYRFNIHVLDESGKVLDVDRDLATLRERYRDHVQDHLQSAGNDFEQTGLSSWSFGDLPESYMLQQNGLQIRAYPGLEDCGDSVNLKLFDNPQEAVVSSVKGMVRLALFSQPQTVKYLRKNLLKNRDLGLSIVDIGGRDQVVDDILCATVKELCFSNGTNSNGGLTESVLIRSQKLFTEKIEQSKSQWVGHAEAIAEQLVNALGIVVDIKKQAKQSKNALVIAYAMADIQQQLSGLFYSNFLYDTPSQWLRQYPRYLKAIQLRLEKVPMQVQKDRVWIEELEALNERYSNKITTDGDIAKALNEALHTYRWMLEELRVSFFAQTLGTSIPVSVKRLNKQWEQC